MQKPSPNNEVVELAKKYYEKRTANDVAKGAATMANEAMEEAKKELIDAMIEAGLKGISLDGIGTLTMSDEVYPAVTAEHKPGFFEYMKASGHGGIIKEDVNPQTFKSFLKNHLVELEMQLEDEGLNIAQFLMIKDDPECSHFTASTPLDPMDSASVAKKIMAKVGASMFSKQNISLKKKL